MNIQTEILNIIKINHQLQEDIDDNEESIRELGFSLLTELQKIDGWENMIESCKEHYKLYPNEFFNWCSVRYNNDSITFVKGYSDGELCDVLTINLITPLKEQVKNHK